MECQYYGECQNMAWQPIEDAPKDGTPVLCTWKSTWKTGKPHVELCEWADDEDEPGGGAWYYTYDGDRPNDPPSHFMTAPSAP